MKTSRQVSRKSDFRDAVHVFFADPSFESAEKLKGFFTLINRYIYSSADFASLSYFLTLRIKRAEPAVLELVSFLGSRIKHLLDTGVDREDLPMTDFETLQEKAFELLSQPLTKTSQRECALILASFDELPDKASQSQALCLLIPSILKKVESQTSQVQFNETPRLVTFITALESIFLELNYDSTEMDIETTTIFLKKILFSAHRFSYLLISRTWKVAFAFIESCNKRPKWTTKFLWIFSALPETLSMPFRLEDYPKDLAVCSSLALVPWYLICSGLARQTLAQNPVLLSDLKHLVSSTTSSDQTRSFAADALMEVISTETLHDLPRLLIEQEIIRPIIELAGSKTEYNDDLCSGFIALVERMLMIEKSIYYHSIVESFLLHAESLGFDDLVVLTAKTNDSSLLQLL